MTARSRPVTRAGVVLAVLVALVSWAGCALAVLYASISLCGISGCGGGGFGVVLDPTGVRVSLGLAGVLAAMPFACWALLSRARWPIVVAVAVLVLVPVLAGRSIGAGWDGEPLAHSSSAYT